VVASVLNLRDFIYDVFGEGIEWDGNQTKRYSKELRDLLEGCLSLNPDNRPDFPEVLKKIREYRFTFQHGLRDELADGKAWEDHLLTPKTTDLVGVRRIRSRSLGRADHFAGIRHGDGS
jgi:serine/threonine protein kinase